MTERITRSECVIEALTSAVARLMAESGRKEVTLGPGGYLIQVDDDGTVSVSGEPVGRDDGYQMAGCLIDAE